jgi:hypothetical protein
VKAEAIGAPYGPAALRAEKPRRTHETPSRDSGVSLASPCLSSGNIAPMGMDYKENANKLSLGFRNT